MHACGWRSKQSTTCGKQHSATVQPCAAYIQHQPKAFSSQLGPLRNRAENQFLPLARWGTY